MFGKYILCQNTVRKSAAAVVSDTRRAGVRHFFARWFARVFNVSNG